MGLFKTLSRVGAGVATGGLSEVAGYKGGTEMGRSSISGVPVIGGLADQLTGQGNYDPNSNYAGLDADTEAARANRNAFAAQYAGLQPGQAPTMQSAQIATGQSNQARGIQEGGVPLQQLGAGVQQGAVGTQQAGIGTQQEGIGITKAGLGFQDRAAGAVGGGLQAQNDAANSYRDVLAGKTPSVAELTGQKLAGEGIAAGFGGAAGARGGNRAMALRAAINGAGSVGAQQAANAQIGRAGEQDAARAGLLGAGSGMSGSGATLGGIGNNVAGVGQGVTAGGQGISATGAGIANTGQGIAQTGQGLTATGTAIRGQDQQGAQAQAAFDQQAAANNQQATIGTRGQDITQQLGVGALTNQATGLPITADSTKIDETRADKAQGQKNQSVILSTIGNVASRAAMSSEQVKTDIAPAGPSVISDLFRSFSADGPKVAAAPDAGSGPMTPAALGAGPVSPAMMSSREVKRDVQPGASEARRTFADILPTTWRYDQGKLASRGLPSPDTEGGDHLGVIAEQVERAGPLGKGMVREVNGTKAIDIPMAVSALMAAMADIEKRLPKGKGARA